MMRRMRTAIQVFFLILFFAVIFNGSMMLWLGLFVISLIGAFVFGRFYCGYVCPMNTLMRGTETLSRKLGWQTKRVPRFLQGGALPWVFLVVMVVTMITSRNLLHKEIPVLLILMGLSVIVTLKYEPWVFHNHLCPYGALLRLTGRHAFRSTRVDPAACIGCKRCVTVCPSKAIDVSSENRKAVIDPSLCHQCQEICSHVCPKDAIHYGKK